MAGLLSDEEEETAKKPPIMESKPASKSPSMAASQGRRGLLMVPGWAESWQRSSTEPRPRQGRLQDQRGECVSWGGVRVRVPEQTRQAQMVVVHPTPLVTKHWALVFFLRSFCSSNSWGYSYPEKRIAV